MRKMLLFCFLITLLVLAPTRAIGQYFSERYDLENAWGWEGGGNPNALATSTSGYSVYATSIASNTVRNLWVPTGSLQKEWGGMGTGDSQLNHPYAIAAARYFIYVADTFNHQIKKFTPEGAFLQKWGKADATNGNGNSEFNTPYGIAVGPGGIVYVADTFNGCIKRFSPDGLFLPENGKLLCNFEPRGIAVDSAGTVYAINSTEKAIFRYNNLRKAWAKFSSAVTMLNPSALALDSYKNVYVADQDTHYVYKFNPAGALIAKLGKGYPDSASDAVNYPVGIAVNPSGNRLYVACMIGGIKVFKQVPLTSSVTIAPTTTTIRKFIQPRPMVLPRR